MHLLLELTLFKNINLIQIVEEYLYHIVKLTNTIYKVHICANQLNLKIYNKVDNYIYYLVKPVNNRLPLPEKKTRFLKEITLSF